MHRSGTSLTARWLAGCGLNLGDRTLDITLGNKGGHFEDLDFLDFHHHLLKDNKQSYLVPADYELNITTYHKKKAEYLVIFKNSLHEQWGWKEPRTTLLLGLYHEFIPHAKYLMVFRHFNQVIDSLWRRHKKFLKKQMFFPRGYVSYYQEVLRKNQLVNEYLSAWICYNEYMLKFFRSQQGFKNCLLVDSEKLVPNEFNILDSLKNWGFKLDTNALSDIYDSKQFHDLQRGFNIEPKLLERATGIYQQLIDNQSFD